MKTVTRFLAVLAVFAPVVLATTASAQAPLQLTVREINQVPEANLQQLQDLGAEVTGDDVDDLIQYEYADSTVQFTAVVLSDPLNSGVRSWPDGAGEPNGVTVFVRDTSAASMGYEGMTIQLLGAGAALAVGGGGNPPMEVGQVYTIVANVDPYFTTMQLAPTAWEALGPYQALGLPDEIMDPVTVGADDLNQVVGTTDSGGPLLQTNWLNFSDYSGQYVRFEDALVTASVEGSNDRANYQWTTSGTDAAVNSNDMSLRYRNDQGSYQPPFNVRDEDFVPPPAGAIIDIQGFATFTVFDFNNDISPILGGSTGALFGVSPWEDEDLVYVESPPVFGDLQSIDFVPGNEPVEISVGVSPGAGRSIASVVLNYESTSGESGEVTLTDDGSGVYSGQIPALPDGDFVTYSVTATDNTGASSTSPTRTYRVLYDGIDSIEDVQITATQGPGASPFAGITTEDINIEAVVMSDPAVSGFLTIQDDPELGAWSGIFVEITAEIADIIVNEGLVPGDRVQITAATIGENFDVTELQDATLTRMSNGAPYDYKVVPTGVLAQDDPTAEAHEGMALRFESVEITDVNADGPDNPGPDDDNYGEWQFSSDGTADNEIRADDASDAIPQTFNIDNFVVGQEIGAIQGLWYYSFNNYKLLPESPEDITFEPLAADDGTQAGTFALDPAYPNPFAGEAKLAFELDRAGAVTLKVYDTLGREVATLVDAELPASRHEVTFDARGLASGVYIYRLTAGGEVLTGRMTLVK